MTTIQDPQVAPSTRRRDDTFRVRATDVTCSQNVEMDIHRDITAAALMRSLVSELELPDNVAWGLRDQRGNYLNEDLPVSRQVQDEDELTVTPRAHLG